MKKERLNVNYTDNNQLDMSIFSLNMSKRLQNCLLKNEILSLSEIRFYTRNQVKMFRNLGKTMLGELDHLCSVCNVDYYVLPELPQHWHKKKSFRVLEKCFSTLQIQSLDVFTGITTLQLFHMLDQNYILTSIIYSFLRTIQVFPPWEDSFLFEYLNLTLVKNIFWHSGIMNMSQLNELIHHKQFYLNDRDIVMLRRALKKFCNEHKYKLK